MERRHGAAGRKLHTYRMAELALLLAVAAVLGYVEAIIPISVGIPGVKLGLANVAILFVLYRHGFREALLVSALRTAIIAALFTNLSALAYSLAGAVCSLCVMALLRLAAPARGRGAGSVFSIYGVSAAGGVAHNVAQLAVAYLILGSAHVLRYWLVWYLPALLLCGLGAGLVNALVLDLTRSRLIRALPEQEDEAV